MCPVPAVRNLYYRESVDFLYSSPAFIISYFLHLLPVFVVSILFFSNFAYWVLGLYPEFVRFVIFTTCVSFLFFHGELVGIIFMSLIFDANRANTASSLFLSIAALVGSGFLRSAETMPTIFSYLRYFTIFRYSSEVLNVNEFSGLELTCNPNLPCDYPNGDTYLEEMYPGAVDRMGANFGAMFLMNLIMVSISVVLFHFLRKALR